MKPQRFFSLLVALLALSLLAGSGPQNAWAGEAYALLVGGTPGAEVYARRYGDWLTRMRSVLVKAGVPEKNIRLLAADPAFKGAPVSAPASGSNLGSAFAELAAGMKPADRFFLVLIGHGVAAEKPPTFVVPGPQPTAQEFAKWLDALPAQSQIVLNFSGSSGAFLAYLAKKGRVNLSALGPEEGSEPVLAEFFLRGLETRRADADKNGEITLLEAFNAAAWELGQWTNRQTQMGQFVMKAGKRIFVPRGDWKVDGKESVETFRKLCDGNETDPGARKLAPESDVKGRDAILPLKPADGRLTEAWAQRRILGEHAYLEDTGTAPGVTPFLPWVPEAADTATSSAPTKPVNAGDSAKPAAGAKPAGTPGATAAQEKEDAGFHNVEGRSAGAPGWLARGIVLVRKQ